MVIAIMRALGGGEEGLEIRAEYRSRFGIIHRLLNSTACC